MKGLLEVAGDDNYLWRDVKSRTRNNVETLILVVPDLSLPPYPGTNMSPDEPANFRWVKVTGIVDTSFHGRFGSDRFALLQKKIEVLPGPRQRQFLVTLAWFKNESGREVKMDIKSLNQEAVFNISPGEVSETGIGRDKGTLEVQTTSGKRIAKCALTPPGSSRYYDSQKHAYYYRILRNGIERVVPSQARDWDIGPYPGRD